MIPFNRIISIVFLLTSLASCKSDFLDVYPKYEMNDGVFWKTEKDAEMALTGLYSNNDVWSSWESFWNILWWDLVSDNGYCQFGHDIAVIGNGQLTPATVVRNYFDYKQIRRCNNFLEKIENVKMDESLKKRYKAEARFLRAYDYFRKVQFYGDVPLVTATIPDPSNAKLAQTPKQEVVNFILKELGEIASDLPVQNVLDSDHHITKGAALALKARLELYEEKYAEAMADAKQVMDMSVYELFPQYDGLFWVKNETIAKEAILEIPYIKDYYSNWIWQEVLPAKEGGWSAITAVQTMVDAYEMANGKTIDDPTSGYNPEKPFLNRDPRFAMTILYPGAWYNGRYFNSLDSDSPDYNKIAAAPRSGYNVLKYSEVVPGDLLQNGDKNVIVIRLAEMLLTYAEAAIEQNIINDEVYRTINKIRNRAGMPDVDRSVYNTQSKLRELIRRERRIELAFEGLRYWDIKRWDIGATALNGPLYGCLEGSVNNQTGEVTWSTTRIKLEDRIFHPERKYLLPIPQSEMDINKNLKQNPGY